MAAIPAVAPQAVNRVASASGLQSRRRQAYAHQRPMSLVAGSTVATGTIYVGVSPGIVNEYSPAAALLKPTIGVPGGFTVDISFDANANVYVFDLASSGSEAVIEYSPSGSVIRTVPMPGGCSPLDAIADAAGDVVFFCNSSTIDLLAIKVSATGVQTRLTYPITMPYVVGLAVDRNGDMYVSEYSFDSLTGAQAGSIVKYSWNGGSPRTIATIKGGIFGNVTVDSVGNVYVINDLASNNIVKYSQAGVLIGAITANVNFAVAMTTDSAGNLYVTNTSVDANGNITGQNWVSIYKPNGALAQSFTAGAANTDLTAIAVAPAPPPPIAAVGVSQLVGDFAETGSGSVAMYATPPPSQIAYLSPDTGTGTAAVTRRALAVAAPPLTRLRVAGSSASYFKPPENLPENDVWLSDFVTAVKDATRLGRLVPACYAYLEESRAVPGLLATPYNAAYYQVQTYCENGASIAQEGSLVSWWQGTSYNGTPSVTAEKAETCKPGPTNHFGLQTCFSAVQLIPIAYAQAELNRPVSLSFKESVYGLRFPFNADYLGHTYAFSLNNRSVPYPVVAADPKWGPWRVDGNVPPPAFGRPGETIWEYTPKSCDETPTSNVDRASQILGAALKADSYSNPSDLSPTPFDAHHLKPSCFGGSNLATNGMWLPNGKSKLNIHNFFNIWFKVANFTPNN